MINPTEEHPIILEALKSKNEIDIITTLQKIKEYGNTSHLIEVINLICKTPSNIVQKQCIEIARLFQSDEMVSILLPMLSSNINTTAQKKLIALCWEANLSLKNDLSIFINLLSNENFEIAIEAYTVITENSTGIHEKKKIEYCEALTSLEKVIKSERKFLIDDCIQLLENV